MKSRSKSSIVGKTNIPLVLVFQPGFSICFNFCKLLPSNVELMVLAVNFMTKRNRTHKLAKVFNSYGTYHMTHIWITTGRQVIIIIFNIHS